MSPTDSQVGTGAGRLTIAAPAPTDTTLFISNGTIATLLLSMGVALLVAAILAEGLTGAWVATCTRPEPAPRAGHLLAAFALVLCGSGTLLGLG